MTLTIQKDIQRITNPYLHTLPSILEAYKPLKLQKKNQYLGFLEKRAK